MYCKMYFCKVVFFISIFSVLLISFQLTIQVVYQNMKLRYLLLVGYVFLAFHFNIKITSESIQKRKEKFESTNKSFKIKISDTHFWQSTIQHAYK